jgi:hypothetical protein
VKPTKSRSGFALIVAVAFVLVVAGLLAVVAGTVEHCARGDRYESDAMAVRQLIDSGAAWTRLHADDWPTTDGVPRTVELDASDLLPGVLDGILTLVPRSDEAGVYSEVEIQASVQRPGRWTIRQVVSVRTESAMSKE